MGPRRDRGVGRGGVVGYSGLETQEWHEGKPS